MHVVDAQSDEESSRDGDEPVQTVLGSPAVPEETNGNETATQDQRRETMFRLHLAVGSFLFLEIAVGEIPNSNLADAEAQTKTEVSQTGLARAEVVDVLENVGECCEEHVHVAVGDGAVEGDDEDDWRFDEEYDWAGDRDSHQLADGLVLLELGSVAKASGF